MGKQPQCSIHISDVDADTLNTSQKSDLSKPLTLEVQYMQDEYDDAEDPDGFIYGLRMTAEFQ